MRRTQEQLEDCLQRLYEMIEGFIAKNGYAPSTREMMDELGFSQQTTRNYLRRLERNGYIRITPGKWRSIIIIPEEERKKPIKPGSGVVYPQLMIEKKKRRLITHVQVGDIIKEAGMERDGNWIYALKEKTYRVTQIYPYHVLTIEQGTGVLRSFSYGDLIMRGLEYQEPEIEAKRIVTESEGRRWR